MSYLIPSLVIGLLALDTTIAFQILLSQPIFACPIIGWLLGNPQIGFEVGIIMQLLWLHIIPVGAAIFPEGNIASMIICAFAVLFEELPYPNLVFTSAVMLGIIVSYAGAWITVLDRKINGAFLNFAQKSAQRGKAIQINLIEAVSIIMYFLIMTAFAFLCLHAGSSALKFLSTYFSPAVEGKLIMIKPVMFGIGIMFTFQLIFKSVKKKIAG